MRAREGLEDVVDRGNLLCIRKYVVVCKVGVYDTVRFARLSVTAYGPKGPMGMSCEVAVYLVMYNAHVGVRLQGDRRHMEYTRRGRAGLAIYSRPLTHRSLDPSLSHA